MRWEKEGKSAAQERIGAELRPLASQRHKNKRGETIWGQEAGISGDARRERETAPLMGAKGIGGGRNTGRPELKLGAQTNQEGNRGEIRGKSGESGDKSGDFRRCSPEAGNRPFDGSQGEKEQGGGGKHYRTKTNQGEGFRPDWLILLIIGY